MKTLSLVMLCSLLGMCAPFALAAQDEKPAAPNANKETAKKYTLRYKFIPGEKIRTRVTHRSKVTNSIKMKTETATSLAVSVKVWKVIGVDKDNNATLVYSIEQLKMSNKIGDKDSVTFNSASDKKPPAGYDAVAKTIGVPLSEMTLDPLGKIVKRERKLKKNNAYIMHNQVTIPLPESEISVGHTWKRPTQVPVQLTGGNRKMINVRHQYKFESIQNNVARIRVTTQVLDPDLSPRIRAQLMQRIHNGNVYFDIKKGRVTYQKMVVHQKVIQVHGPGSFSFCKMEFVEQIISDAYTASKKK